MITVHRLRPFRLENKKVYSSSTLKPDMSHKLRRLLEVDPETGAVKILRYVVAHDCGKLINPLLVDGQIRGGVVHRIGNALFERALYDEQAQPLTTNYADYLLPSAPQMPRAEISHLEQPSPLNPIGVKGAGEGGTIRAAACIVAAIQDGLTPFSVKFAERCRRKRS
jgi:aerobic carbon-monoxide dehydrogenase large subunit